ncbi:hypothetical protein [Winogradskyella sp. A3E31]|uniref:hypothetical protein n=1 Tax=Winogradskyella sp. A3E31 TaxID=3349637 RepID=UPI00398AE222
MNFIKIKVMLCATAIAFVSMSLAQGEEKMYQMYEIHEDQVKPSMMAQYEKTAKIFADKMREHKIADGDFLTITTDDFRYLSVRPIDSLGQENPGMSELWEKMGQEDFSEMMSGFNPCYDRHGSYVIFMDKELTYMPEGISQTPDGKNYRKFYYIYYSPQNGSKMREAMMDVKKLFESKNSKSSYRVYHSGYGTMDSFYMIAIAGEDAVALAEKAKENDNLLGEDAGPIFQKVIGLALKMEEFTGSVRPELSYMNGDND